MKIMSWYRAPLIVLALLTLPAVSNAQAFGVGVSIGVAPPPLPVYVQPPCPGVGYLWTPGYWAYDPVYGYYWVPGTWVLAPAVGLLWTPGYWGFGEGFYHWHGGYWGPRVGFYGGVDYGFGYFGTGFEGGHWRGRDFLYNRSVTNVTNVSITNVYNERVVHDTRADSRVSFNGGPGGIGLRATAAEEQAGRDPHYGATAQQQRHLTSAHGTPALRASVNHGQPSIAATPRPGVFAGRGISAAQGREMTAQRAPNSAVERAHVAPSRPAADQARVDAHRPATSAPRANGPNAAGQPIARGNAPERPAPAPRYAQAPAPRNAQAPAPRNAQAPAPPRYAQEPAPRYAQAPAPRYAQAPAPRYAPQPAPRYAQEPARGSAPPRQAPAPRYEQAPERRGEPAREGGPAPRREPGRD